MLYCFRRCAIQCFASGTPIDFDPLRFSLFVHQDLKQNLSFPALSQAATVPLSGAYTFGGHTYYALKDGALTWQQAEASSFAAWKKPTPWRC